MAGHYRCTSGQVVTSQKTPQISVAQVSYGVSTDRSVRKNNKKTTTWKCTEPNDTDLIIHHFIFSSTNVSKLSDPQERLFLITCFIMIGFSNGCSDVGSCGLIFMATVAVFKTQLKKLSVLLPWISNHKHKIKVKFEKSSQSSSKIVCLGLTDWQ